MQIFDFFSNIRSDNIGLMGVVDSEAAVVFRLAMHSPLCCVPQYKTENGENFFSVLFA